MNLLHDFARLFFPHQCAGCGTDSLNRASPLCIRCLHALPVTNFHSYAGNPVEKIFAGRIPFTAATAYCHFARDTMMQQVLHALKYRGRRDVARLLGRMMGQCLQASGRFDDVAALAPVPLHAAKERRRGYNQSLLLCEGMAEVWRLPVITKAVLRISPTGTQTNKSRVERWQNMEGRFMPARPELIEGRHLLLVDDVITTGATMEACAGALLQAKEIKLSVAALALADG